MVAPLCLRNIYDNLLPNDFFSPLIDQAKKLIQPTQTILFSSSARGDQQDKSDIDLAFKFSGSQENWILFKSWVDDNFQTLRKLDLVNLDEADQSIVESIKKEGMRKN